MQRSLPNTFQEKQGINDVQLPSIVMIIIMMILMIDGDGDSVTHIFNALRDKNNDYLNLLVIWFSIF